MDTLKSWLNTASAWIAANPTDTVYIAAALAGFTVLTVITGGERRR
jgi:hypothetical protein